MRAYGRHVLICAGGRCAPEAEAERLVAQAQALARELGLSALANPQRAKCSECACLGWCQDGPLVVVYPEGLWYRRVDPALLGRIYREHVLEGRPVHEAVFHRLDAGATPSADSSEEIASPGLVADSGNEVEAAPDAEHELGEPGSTPEAEARRRAVRRDRRRKGLLIVHTGDGKGKTTAALGLAMRAWGRGLRVGVIQFMKPDGARFGEVRAARRMGIYWQATGNGFTWTSPSLDQSAEMARAGWELARARIVSGEDDLLVLDELTYPLHYGWLDTNEVIAWIAQHKPTALHLAITGRHAPPALVACADLVTEMRQVRHPFHDQGIGAQPGIEF